MQEHRTRQRGWELHDATPASRGDVAAFSRLMEARSGRLRGIAQRVLGAEDAEDVYQEVWIRVWRSIGGYGKSAFATWLYMVATNTYLGLLRSRTRREARRRDGEESFLAALVLSHAEGFSYAEIAGLLDVPHGTAKGWVNRGRVAMLLVLAEENGAA